MTVKYSAIYSMLGHGSSVYKTVLTPVMVNYCTVPTVYEKTTLETTACISESAKITEQGTGGGRGERAWRKRRYKDNRREFELKRV